MTRNARTRVSLFPLVLAAVIVAFGPRAASAAPIVHNFDVAADGTLQTFDGIFDFDNDVALVTFVLGEGVFDFTASTTSYAAGGFDPALWLYFAAPGSDLTNPLNLALYRSVGPDGGVFPVQNDDQDLASDRNDSLLSLRLVDAGTYILALTQTGNAALEDELFFDQSDDQLRCFASNDEGACGALVGGRNATFAGTLSVTDVNAATVPEPGTLSLLGLGALATCLRRRRTRSVTTRQ